MLKIIVSFAPEIISDKIEHEIPVNEVTKINLISNIGIVKGKEIDELVETLNKNTSIEDLNSWLESKNILSKSKLVKTINYLFISNVLELNLELENKRIGRLTATRKKAILCKCSHKEEMSLDNALSGKVQMSTTKSGSLRLFDARSHIQIEWNKSEVQMTKLAAAWMSGDYTEHKIPNSLINILADNNFLETTSSKTSFLWEDHDYNFNYLTRNYDDNKNRTGNYRFGTDNKWANSLDIYLTKRPLKFHERIGLPPYSQRLPESICENLSETILLDLFSRAFANLDAREMPEGWQDEKYKSERCHRPYPSAGGIYEQSFYLVKSKSMVKEGESTLYRYVCSDQRFESLTEDKYYQAQVFNYMKRCWAAETPPPYILLMIGNYASLSYKYSNIAYRLMLINAGCALSSFYRACQSLNIGCCPGGTGPSQVIHELLKLKQDEELPILEVGFGRKL